MRNLLTLKDWDPGVIQKILLNAGSMKAARNTSYWAICPWLNSLEGLNIVLYFEKPSLRTHLTFDIAIKKLGGNAVYFDNSKQMGREPDTDIARNITRWADGIVARVYKQETLEIFANEGNIPVINALSDMYHPCQALADYMTMLELVSKEAKDLKVAYIGEPNNVSNSLMIMASKLNIKEFAICCPASMSPDFLLLNECKKVSTGKIYVTAFPEDLKDYDVIYCDTWFSMGDTTNSHMDKEKILQPYQVNQDLLDKLNIPYVLHCLPCHRGQEITDDVIEKHPEIYQLAENRLWTEMSVLYYIFR